MINHVEDARIRFTVELVSHPQFNEFAKTQELSDKDGRPNAKAVSEWVRNLIGQSQFEQGGHMDAFSDFVPFLIFVSSRYGQIDKIEMTRIYKESGIFGENSLFRPKVISASPAV